MWRACYVSVRARRGSRVGGNGEGAREIRAECQLIVGIRKDIKPEIILVRFSSARSSDDHFLNVWYAVQSATADPGKARDVIRIVVEPKILSQTERRRSDVKTASHRLARHHFGSYVITAWCQHSPKTWHDAITSENRSTNSTRTCVDDTLPKLGCLNVTNRRCC